MAANKNANTSANAAVTAAAEEKKVPFLKVADNAAKDGLLFTVTSTIKDFGSKQIEFKFASVSDELRSQAMKHGFNQKIRDASAGFGEKKNKDGVVTSQADPHGAIEAMQAVVDTLLSGSWNKVADNGASQIKPKLARAIAQIQSTTIEQAMAVIDRQTDEAVWRGWWTSEKVQQVWTKIAADDAAAKVTDEHETSLMASLNAAFQ
jgi:hypothetical protein